MQLNWIVHDSIAEAVFRCEFTSINYVCSIQCGQWNPNTYVCMEKMAFYSIQNIFILNINLKTNEIFVRLLISLIFIPFLSFFSYLFCRTRNQVIENRNIWAFCRWFIVGVFFRCFQQIINLLTVMLRRITELRHKTNSTNEQSITI